MNRKKFAFSWGRKIFFGLSFPLSCVLGFIYLRSYILPETASEWIYFIFNVIGHFGLLNALVYFLFFSPVVALVPSYYIARFWSLFLVMSLNILILLDGISFSQYQMHLYSFLGKLYLEDGIQYLLPSQILLTVASVGALVLALFIWLRGESYWRQMQGRFSNPIKNWYLAVIFLSVIISKLFFHYGDIHPQLGTVLPLDVKLPKEATLLTDKRKFHYPKGLSCQGKKNPNLIMVALKEWGSDQLTPEVMPHVHEMKKHAVNFNNHQNVAFNGQSGLFALFYSIPATYEPLAQNTKPFLLNEMNKRNYEILDWGRGNEDAFSSFQGWAHERHEDDEKPYFISMVFNKTPAEVDAVIQEMVLILQKKDLLNNTYIVMTGGYSGKTMNQSIPFLYFMPDRKFGEVSYSTSHYDVIPTLVSDMWNCKNAYELTGIGQSLYDQNRSWLLASESGHFRITDLQNNSIVEVLDGSVTIEGSVRNEMIFSAIKLMNKFYRPQPN